jgi:hypothetical protein
MKGHIRERSPGHWAIVLDVIDPASGKKKRKWYSFKGTKRQAQDECARLITASSNDAYIIEPSKVTVAECLSRWLAHHLFHHDPLLRPAGDRREPAQESPAGNDRLPLRYHPEERCPAVPSRSVGQEHRAFAPGIEPSPASSGALEAAGEQPCRRRHAAARRAQGHDGAGRQCCARPRRGGTRHRSLRAGI